MANEVRDLPQMRSGPWLLKSKELFLQPNMGNSTGTGLSRIKGLRVQNEDLPVVQV